MSGTQRRKGAFKIEPFRHRVELDPQYAEKTWKVLEDAIHHINNHNASGLSFEELYRSAYNMVLHKFGDRLYSGLVATLTAHLQRVSDLVEQKSGGLFLEELCRRWENHNKSMQMIRDILMYMDRTYVTQQTKMPVHELGLVLWRDHVVRASNRHDRLLVTLLDLVQKERNSETIDRGMMRNVTLMLMDLGQQVYVEDFEVHFLRATSEFYSAEAQSTLAASDCPTYLRKAEERLQEEVQRVAAYMVPEVTEPKVTEVVEREMIGKQLHTLVEMPASGLVPMMLDDKLEDLHRMYTLFRRVPGGLTVAKDALVEHLRETGKALVTDQERQKDPVEFVQKLLDQKDKYDVIIREAFSNDKIFQNALNQAFEYFINLNMRSPEYISLFVDDKLKKSGRGTSDQDIEAVLDRVMTLFRYLQEKDAFERYYKAHLAKRLLSGRNFSDDYERSFIQKIKTECGYQFTSKIEGMFNDVMRTSRDMMVSFKGMLAAGGGGGDARAVKGGEGGAGAGAGDRAGDPLGGIDLNVQVLTTGSWPHTQQGAQCRLPEELERCCETFNNFYLGIHTGRRLTWQFGLGTAEVKATFDGGAKRHELVMNTYQMCIVLLFNGAERLTAMEIGEATNIEGGDLTRTLQSLTLVKGKNVLKKEPDTKEVAPTDVFTVNDGFTNKLYKVKVATNTAHKETEPEKQETRHRIEEDRKPQIEAAIVRIMKSRRVLDHNAVVQEVTKQLSSRFIPNPTVIKKRIESLIERDFLERDATDRKNYRYLA